MKTKKLKYQSFLEKFPNCPPDNFQPVDRDAYRWTKKNTSVEDFIPMHLMKTPPNRILENMDLMCKGYGLSLFDTLHNAKAKYLSLYNKKRQHQREQFIEDCGDYVSYVRLTKSDGVVGEIETKNYGHFTFHEYENTFLADKTLPLQPIFENNVPD